MVFDRICGLFYQANMRGYDYMSASAKKKLRKEENAAQLTEKQLQEQKEAKKLKAYTTVFVVAIALVLVVALVFAGINFYTNSGIKEKNTVAAEIAGHQINAVEMSYYYSDTVENNYNNWYQSYGENMALFMSMYGLDMTKPLSEQSYSEDTTWADYFVDMALSTAQRDYLLSDLAKAEGFTLSEESQATMDQTFDNLHAYATIYGYTIKINTPRLVRCIIIKFCHILVISVTSFT